jgi:hypothetical protein
MWFSFAVLPRVQPRLLSSQPQRLRISGCLSAPDSAQKLADAGNCFYAVDGATFWNQLSPYVASWMSNKSFWLHLKTRLFQRSHAETLSKFIFTHPRLHCNDSTIETAILRSRWLIDHCEVCYYNNQNIEGLLDTFLRAPLTVQW